MNNNKKLPKIHKKTGQSCLICDEKIDSNTSVFFHKTRRQSHSLCSTCAVGYINPLLKTILSSLRQNIRKDVELIKCPGGYHSLTRNQCNHHVSIKNIELPLNESDDLHRAKLTLASPLTFLCPNRKCGAVIDVDPMFFYLRLHCVSCQSSWCRQCLAFPYHEDKSCLEFEVENKRGENASYIWEMSKQGLIKFCPRCRAPTFRAGGCNKMLCEQCKIKWCWLCRKDKIDYDHFNANSKTPCSNKLWEGVET